MSGDRRNERIRKQKPIKKYHILGIITFTVLFVYILGYLVAFMQKPSISIETVNYGTIDVPQSLHGIIVRDEAVVTSTMAGTPSYEYSEYERVKKDAEVCTVKESSDAQQIEDKIREIDENILKEQENKSDFSLFKDDINRISKNIMQSFDANAYKFMNGSFSDAYSLKNSIQTQIDLRNQIWITESTESRSELSGERSVYENELSAHSTSYTTPYSGVLSLRVDHMEDILTPETMANIAPEQTKMTVQPEYISKVLDVNAESPLFRVVKSNVWYVAAYIPNDVAETFNVGDSLNIYTMVDDAQLSTDVTVESMEQGEKETYTVFRSDQKMIDFIDIRTMDFKIRSDSYNGFKIPNAAIVERVFLKIPKGCVRESLGDMSVIVRNGGTDTLMSVKISDEDGDFYLVEQKFGSLQVGTVLVSDTAVTNDTDESIGDASGGSGAEGENADGATEDTPENTDTPEDTENTDTPEDTENTENANKTEDADAPDSTNASASASSAEESPATGDSSGTYTIGEVSTLKGVYVANSSVAEFTVIDVIASNAEYSIVDAENQYGLKVYDKIVSDAKAVEEDEAVN